MRELTGSKGRAALGATAVGVATAIVGALDGLKPEVAIALIVGVTIMATAYIVTTGLEDKGKLEKERAEKDLESLRIRSMVPTEVLFPDPEQETRPERRRPPGHYIPEEESTIASEDDGAAMAERVRREHEAQDEKE